jgi:hypothetical protein
MASPRSAERRRGSAAALQVCASLAPGVAFLGWFVGTSWFENAGEPWFLLSDDAMVSMTYARTLVETGEWVWFPGADRVQGFTNPLWTLFLALLQGLGLSGPSAALAVILVGVALVVLCALTAGRVVHELMPGARWRRSASLLTVATVPLLYPLVFWTLRGMEVGLLALLLLVVVLAATRTLHAWDAGLAAGRPLAVVGAAAAVGVATRLDFVLLAGAVMAVLLWWAPRRGQVIRAGLIPAIAAGIVLGFQRVYYGDWLPNTYTLKMEGVPVADRVLHGLWTAGKSLPWLLLAGLGTAAVLVHVQERYVRRAAVVLATAVAVSVAYHVWVGGDAWESSAFANRFLSVALPLVVVVLIRGVAAWLAVGAPGGLQLVVGALGAVAIAAGGLGLVPFPDHVAPEGVVLGMATAAVLIPMGFLAFSAFRRRPHAFTTAAVCLATAAVAMLMVTSLLPAAAHLQAGAEENRGDSQAIRAGLALSTITEKNAKVAVWAAGAVGYYSRRPMIDVLGKSDRRIAGLPARQTLGGRYIGVATGHDKWDLGISVRELAPDVVYGPWSVPEILDELRGYGYEPLCTTDGIPFYVREGSLLVHRESLRACTPAELDTP